MLSCQNSGFVGTNHFVEANEMEQLKEFPHNTECFKFFLVAIGGYIVKMQAERKGVEEWKD